MILKGNLFDFKVLHLNLYGYFGQFRWSSSKSIQISPAHNLIPKWTASNLLLSDEIYSIISIHLQTI